MTTTFKTQDPKYDIFVQVNTDGIVTSAFLVNASTGVGIPEDEPVFLIRAKDKYAIKVLSYYADACTILSDHYLNTINCIREFMDFARKYPERMKNPDID